MLNLFQHLILFISSGWMDTLNQFQGDIDSLKSLN